MVNPRQSRLLTVGIGLQLAMLVLIGCKTAEQKRPMSSAPAPLSMSIDFSDPNPIQVGDSVTIRFSELPTTLERTFQIPEDGKLSLPLNLVVFAIGKTTKQLENEILEKYFSTRYLRFGVSVSKSE